MSRDETLRRLVCELQRLGYGEPKRQPVEWGVLSVHVLAAPRRTGERNEHGDPIVSARMCAFIAFADGEHNIVEPVYTSGRFYAAPKGLSGPGSTAQVESALHGMARSRAIIELHEMGWELHSGDVFVRYEYEVGA